MADQEHVRILHEGVAAWNAWRERNPTLQPDLSLLVWRFNHQLSGINLSHANLVHADFTEDFLDNANLAGADLSWAVLRGAALRRSDLRNALLFFTDLRNATLAGADMAGAYMNHTYLDQATVAGANLAGVRCFYTNFGDVEVAAAKGLPDVIHEGPSNIYIDMLLKRALPLEFLRGIGVADNLIEHLPSIVRGMEPLELASCFISYSHNDDQFTRRLYSRLREAHVRVWFAPEDIRGGEKVYVQVDRAIQAHDRVLIVLSENSLRSDWVITEIRKARATEIREGRRKLFPIRLVDWDTLTKWECFDSDSGRDLAVEVREYFIPDFSDWRNPSAFEAACERLLRDLNAAQ